MRSFEVYTSKIEELAKTSLRSLESSAAKEIVVALNGGPGSELRRLIPLEKRRQKGAFFTHSKLAKQAIRILSPKLSSSAVLLDPACGAGDLLIACTKYLAVASNLEDTLELWGTRLVGYDLDSRFVRLTKARLLLAAIARGLKKESKAHLILDLLFPRISVGDGLRLVEKTENISHVLLNPPYFVTETPKNSTWSSGKVSMAAIFVEKYLSHLAEGTEMIAILPDVLRTGGRYGKWRDLVLTKASIENLRIVGQFDCWTDIDVFICHMSIGNKKQKNYRWWRTPFGSDKGLLSTVGDLFDVYVGTVVPFRHRQVGRKYTYVHARGLPPWKTVRHWAERRKFSGSVFSTPLVVIRRTSRPGKTSRATGTIIASPKAVAVENHLLVLQPKDGTLKSCRDLLNNIRRDETNKWLNQRIRCRHLTVSSIRELPWWEKKK